MINDSNCKYDDDFKKDLIARAAFITREELKRKQIDGNNNRTIFVFDTDLIKTACAPWSNGPLRVDVEKLSRSFPDYLHTAGGYGQILPSRVKKNNVVGDSATNSSNSKILRVEKKQAEAIAKILATSLITSNKNLKLPIAQLPDHFIETKNLYTGLKLHLERSSKGILETGIRSNYRVNKAKLELSNKMKTQLALISSEIKEQEDEPSRNFSIANSIAVVMREILDHDFPTNKAALEWDNFVNLHVHSFGLFSISEMKFEKLFSEEKRKNDFYKIVDYWCKLASFVKECEKSGNKDDIRGDSRPADVLRFENVRNLVRSNIQDNKSIYNKENFDADVYGISLILLMNERLQEQDIEIEFVFITGDKNLSLLKSNLSQELEKSLPEYSTYCIQHIWSYLTGTLLELEANKEEPEANNTDGQNLALAEHFSGLLAKWYKADEVDIQFLGKLARPHNNIVLPPIDDKEIDEAYKKWSELAERAEEKYEFDQYKKAFSNELDLEVQDIFMQAASKGYEYDWGRIFNKIGEVVRRARDRSGVEFSDIGADSIIAAHEAGVRNPPELMFDSLTHSNDIFKKLASADDNYKNAEDFKRDYDEIKWDCYESESANFSAAKEKKDKVDDRQEVHLKYLVLAALFASADRWINALQHAQNAIAIVERAKDMKMTITPKTSKSNISGREAYYLSAVAKRVLARDEKQIAKTLKDLKKAGDCLDYDHSLKNAQNVSAIRFDNERLANALSQYYYMRSTDKDNLQDSYAEEVFKQTSELIKVLEAHKSGKSKNNYENISSVRQRTKVNISVNLIQCYVILKFRKLIHNKVNDYSLDDAQIHDALAIICENSNFLSQIGKRATYDTGNPVKQSVISTKLITGYTIAAAILLENSPLHIQDPKNIVTSVFEKMDDSYVAVYDPWRYSALKGFLNKIGTMN